ncbi:hypothetical protein TRAPUB_2688 [Trametes pubescens]|uniref:Uncharacterized protein n=1 Tax=Trametes pubescens TaxID=154538 RepID=A0A1M2VFW4_TRAPU|nr:hypothetical protein TRAPUB_2688 [Trametes pubescens]
MNMAEVRESSDEVAIDGAVDSPPRAFEDNLDFQEVFPKTSRIVLGPDEYYRTQASDTALNHPGHNAVSLEFTVDLSTVPHGTNSKTVASPLTRQTATPRTCPRTAKDRAGAICSVCGSCEDERRRPTRTCHGNALRATGVLDDVNGQKIRDLQEHAFDELNGTGATPSPSEYIDLRDGGVPDASVLPDPYSFPSAWTTFTEEA